METIWYRAAKYFCSLWATQNLSRSPSLMLRLIYLHRFTSFGVILWGKKNNHAAVAFAPFLLILLKSGPTDDETFLPFSGSLWNRFLIFKAEKTSAHLGFVALTDPHITYPDMKTKGTTTSKKCHQHIILWATPAAEVRQLQDVRPCQSCPGGFSLIHTQTGGEI